MAANIDGNHKHAGWSATDPDVNGTTPLESHDFITSGVHVIDDSGAIEAGGEGSVDFVTAVTAEVS